MQLSIITPTFNGEKFIKGYLDSVTKNLPKDCEIIIVDNGSDDKTVNFIEKYPLIKLIKNSTNLGFGRANNQGVKMAKGEYLLFVNQDITVRHGSIEKMLGFLKEHPEVGIVGPKLINPNNQVQASVSHFPSLWRAVKEYLLNQKNSYLQYIPRGKEPVEVEVVYGAVILIKKDLFIEVGGWDERYFVYYEDIELCRQVKKYGFKIIYLPNVIFKHLLGASSKKVEAMPFGIRTLSWFWPVKKSGSRYLMLQSARTFHGILIATAIRSVMYIGVKLGHG